MRKLFGSLDNRLCEGAIIGEVKIGAGVTELMYSDRHAYTIVAIPDSKHIIIRECTAIRIDGNGASDCQAYEYQTQEKKSYTQEDLKEDSLTYILMSDRRKKQIKKYGIGENEKVLTLTKNGYKEMGNCNGFMVGKRDEYYDYSF